MWIPHYFLDCWLDNGSPLFSGFICSKFFIAKINGIYFLWILLPANDHGQGVWRPAECAPKLLGVVLLTIQIFLPCSVVLATLRGSIVGFIVSPTLLILWYSIQLCSFALNSQVLLHHFSSNGSGPILQMLHTMKSTIVEGIEFWIRELSGEFLWLRIS